MPMMLSLSAIQEKVSADLEACRAQLRDCEKAFQHSDYRNVDGDQTQFDSEKDALKYRLRQCCTSMLLLFEVADLPLFRDSFLSGWKKFKSKLDDVGHISEEPEWLYSEPLIYLAEAHESVSAGLTQDVPKINGLVLLQQILRHTPLIIEDTAKVPASESEVRAPVFNVLKTVFPDVKREVPIPQISKTYRADIGIPSLKACVEFKFAENESELKNEIDGVFSDMKGYAGVADWVHFFAVFYTAKPVMSQDRLEHMWKQVGAERSWTPIIVHGAGQRLRKLSRPDRNVPLPAG